MAVAVAAAAAACMVSQPSTRSPHVKLLPIELKQVVDPELSLVPGPAASAWKHGGLWNCFGVSPALWVFGPQRVQSSRTFAWSGS